MPTFHSRKVARWLWTSKVVHLDEERASEFIKRARERSIDSTRGLLAKLWSQERATGVAASRQKQSP